MTSQTLHLMLFIQLLIQSFSFHSIYWCHNRRYRRHHTRCALGSSNHRLIGGLQGISFITSIQSFPWYRQRRVWQCDIPYWNWGSPSQRQKANNYWCINVSNKTKIMSQPLNHPCPISLLLVFVCCIWLCVQIVVFCLTLPLR